MTRICLAQINPWLGAFKTNYNLHEFWIKKASQEGASAIFFPELSLCGYNPNDLYEEGDFESQNEKILERIRHLSGQTVSLKIGVGHYQKKIQGETHRAFNTYSIYENGHLICRYEKRLLPTYDVFDEKRYFEPGISQKSMKTDLGAMALSICEDFWFNHHRYERDPLDELPKNSFLLNASASPFEIGKSELRQCRAFEILKKAPSLRGIFYCNSSGSQDELTFDGGSFYAFQNEKTYFYAQAPSFAEGLLVLDFKPESEDAFQGLYQAHFFRSDEKTELVPIVSIEKKSRAQPQLLLGTEGSSKCSAIFAENDADYESIYKALILGLRDFFRKNELPHKALIGLSGGIDSALVAVLASHALGASQIHGLAMPSKYSSDHSLKDAEDLARRLGISFEMLSIEGLHQHMGTSIFGSQGASGVADENLQARIRGMILMARSNATGWPVLATGNKSELAVGYSTLYGDLCGALLVLGDLYKTEVTGLSRWINKTFGELIPVSTLNKEPSAELRHDQKDVDTLPSYDVLDSWLLDFLGKRKSLLELEQLHGSELTRRISDLVLKAEFKRRQAPPILRLRFNAFGLGRRIPLGHGLGKSGEFV